MHRVTNLHNIFLQAQAAADKERYAREVEMYGPPPARKTKAKNTAAEPKEKRPKAKTGCEVRTTYTFSIL